MNTGLLLLFTVACILPSYVLATVTEKNQALNDLHGQIKQVDDAIKTLNIEKAAQLEDLKKLEKQYGELANSLLSIKNEVTQQQEKLSEIRNKLSLTQKDYQTQKRALEGLLKSAYAIGDQEGLKLLLNQRDPSLSGRMLVYLDYISKARLQKIQNIHESFAALQQLELQKTTENQLLFSSLKKKQLETERMLLIKSQRENLLAKLNIDYQSQTKQKQKLLYDEKKLASLVASLQKTDDNSYQQPVIVPEQDHKPEAHLEANRISVDNIKNHEKQSFAVKSFAELKGELSWPVLGVISEHFGSRRFDTPLDGAVISAHEGADIHSVAAGRVVFADWIVGFGLMLIVDHGDGYMSLYGFNQSLHKKLGESVDAGALLASVGRSGGRAEASVYFGIRKNGKPINPELWCGKTTKN